MITPAGPSAAPPAAGPEPYDRRVAAMAGWARGRALRQLGRHRDATAQLHAAYESLAAVGDPAAARVAVSLALLHADSARFDEAIDLLDRAAAELPPAERARALAQKALVLQRSDRDDDARTTWDEVVDDFTAAGMPVERAVAMQNRGLVAMYHGDLAAAERDLAAAETVLSGLGQDIRAAEASHNLGLVLARRGDLPGALARFDQAQAQVRRLGVVRPQMLVDRVQVTLEAGLAGEGRQLAETAARIMEDEGYDTDLPEACLLAARACELDDDLTAAANWAARAADLFERQERPRWTLLARLSELRVAPPGPAGAPDPTGAPDPAGALHLLAGQLLRAGWGPAALEADALAVRRLADCAATASSDKARRDCLERASTIVSELRRAAVGSPPLPRLQIRLAQTTWATAAGRFRDAHRALVGTVRALREYESTLGSIELRSRAGGQAEAVIGAGLQLARSSGQPHVALWCAEAVRLAVAGGASQGLDDQHLTDLIGAVRQVEAQLARLSEATPAAARLRRRRAALEELVRRRSRQSRGGGGRPQAPVTAGRIEQALDGATLIEYATAGDQLYGIVVSGGTTRLVELGPVAAVRRVAAGLRLTLGLEVAAEQDRPALRAAPPVALLEAALSAETLLIEPLGPLTGDRLVIVPDGALASFPWPVMPALAATELSVATSAYAWIHSRGRHPLPPAPRVVLVAGPDLKHAEAEVAAVADIWPTATVLAGADATVDAVLDALGGADLVHIAAHATHRGDHPLLSGIRLHDGHLTGHELSTRRIPAGVVVLSCCETGMAESASGIGLSRLITQTGGAAAAVASVSPLADRSAGPLMIGLHRRLAGGAGPARALRESRDALGGPLRYPSAAGIVCFGAG